MNKGSDLDLIPDELASIAVSDREIVLPYKDALKAIEHLNANGHVVFAWEGWLRYANGTRGHSAKHQGMAEVSRDPNESPRTFSARATRAVLTTMESSQAEWTRNPERTDAALYFCLSVERGANIHP